MFTIIKARYGANNTFIDVTDKVKSLLQRDGYLIVSNHHFGDPIIFVTKNLVVESSIGTLFIPESDILTNNGTIYIESDPTMQTNCEVLRLRNPFTEQDGIWTKRIGNNPINIVFYSNCQNRGISYFLKKYYASRGIYVNIDISMQNYCMISQKIPLDEKLLGNADIFIYQPISEAHGIYSTFNNKNNIMSYLKKDCIKIAFPYVYNSAFWCLLTPALGDGFTGDNRALDVGKYVNTEPIRKLKEQGLSLQDVLEKYRNNDIDFEYEARFNNNLNILREKEKKCDIIVSDFIRENAGKIRLFYLHGHPTTAIFVHCANQVLNILYKDAPKFPYTYPEQNFTGNNWSAPHTTHDNNFWKFNYSVNIDDEYYVPHITKIYLEANSNKSNLKELATIYALDKVMHYENQKYLWGHNYVPGYLKLFELIDHKKIKNVLEIGLGFVLSYSDTAFSIKKNYRVGNSLRMWRDYFENANIYGIDINSSLLFEEERIKTFAADQSSEKDLNDVISKIGNKLDIILDDGSHQLDHQVKSFEILNKYLNDGGLYIIEDVLASSVDKMRNLSAWSEETQKLINDNYTVYMFDTRKTSDDCDFIIAFYKQPCLIR